MATILVTGGSGFIGSHTCISLLDQGYDGSILDSLANSYISVLDKIKTINKEETEVKFVKGDLRDISLIETVFQDAKDRGKEIGISYTFCWIKSRGPICVIPLNIGR